MIENLPLPQGPLGSDLMGKSRQRSQLHIKLPLLVSARPEHHLFKALTNRTQPQVVLIARRWANSNPVFLIAPFMPRRFPCLGSGCPAVGAT